MSDELALTRLYTGALSLTELNRLSRVQWRGSSARKCSLRLVKTLRASQTSLPLLRLKSLQCGRGKWQEFSAGTRLFLIRCVLFLKAPALKEANQR